MQKLKPMSIETIKRKKAEYAKEYNQRPEVKARQKLRAKYYRAYYQQHKEEKKADRRNRYMKIHGKAKHIDCRPKEFKLTDIDNTIKCNKHCPYWIVCN